MEQSSVWFQCRDTDLETSIINTDPVSTIIWVEWKVLGSERWFIIARMRIGLIMCQVVLWVLLIIIHIILKSNLLSSCCYIIILGRGDWRLWEVQLTCPVMLTCFFISSLEAKLGFKPKVSLVMFLFCFILLPKIECIWE